MSGGKEAREAAKASLYQALAEPIGVVLAETLDLPRARQVLYSTRTALGDPELSRLQFRLVELEEGARIVIVKGEKLAQPAAYEPLANNTSPNLGDLDL